MMAYPDGSPGAERASQHCQQQQGALGNAPGVAAGTLFIHSKNDQRQQIDQQQIDGESCDMLAEKSLILLTSALIPLLNYLSLTDTCPELFYTSKEQPFQAGLFLFLRLLAGCFGS